MGQGKSTFMGFVKRALRRQAIDASGDVDRRRSRRNGRADDATWPRGGTDAAGTSTARLGPMIKGSAGRRRYRAESVVTVFFNAWRYQDAKQIWAGLAKRLATASSADRLAAVPAAAVLRLAIPQVAAGLDGTGAIAAAVLGVGLRWACRRWRRRIRPPARSCAALLPVGSALLVAWVVLSRAYRAAAR
jgi:hypothetical protein